MRDYPNDGKWHHVVIRGTRRWLDGKRLKDVPLRYETRPASEEEPEPGDDPEDPAVAHEE